MKFSKMLISLPVALAMYACGDDKSSAPEPDPLPDNSTILSSASTPDVPPVDLSSAADVPPPTPSGVSLPAGASVEVSNAMYQIWKNRWVITLEEEKAGGSTLDYDLFTSAGAVALITQKTGANTVPARVIWDGGTKKLGALDGMTTWRGEAFQSVLQNKLGLSVSEGIGYGMLLAAVHEDWTTFNSLWAYNIIARDNSNYGLMPWRIHSFSKIIDTQAAMDADIDVATSLIIAGAKTGNALYTNDAVELIGKLYTSGVHPQTLLILPGETWKSRDVYNLSYFSPAAIKLFAAVDGAHDWNAVLNANYDYMAKVQAAGAVPLFPDWSNAAGVPVDPENGSAKSSYMLFDKESVRIPWRIAWDYYWNQDTRAQAILAAMANFIANSVSYNPEGLPKTSYNYLTGVLSESKTTGLHYTGEYCLMGLGVDQPWIDACYAYFTAGVNAYPMQGYSGTYFLEILMNLFASLMNGNFVKPF